MKKPSAETIIKTYAAMTNERGGVPVGERVFVRESGLSRYHWMGGYWRSWSAFQEAAGYAPNDATPKTPDEVALRRFAELVMERGSVPTEADINLKRKSDPSFPNKQVFRRWGSRNAMLDAAVAFCQLNDGLAPALEILTAGTVSRVNHRLESLDVHGFVYLLRSGKNFKIGRTNAAGRRLRELAIQLPEKPDAVHVIETDDPEGIEQYWHRRFAEKRQGGEWFVLTPDDVRAFKKRRFQ